MIIKNLQDISATIRRVRKEKGFYMYEDPLKIIHWEDIQKIYDLDFFPIREKGPKGAFFVLPQKVLQDGDR